MFRDGFQSKDLEVFVRRRIWFALTVVTAASLVVGVGMALAASPKKASAKSPTKPITLRCKVSLTTEPAAGSNTVDQGASQGSQYGPTHCSRSAFGGGVEAASFTVADSGDTVGTYTQYFGAGTIKGAFDLTPGESPPPSSGSTFQSQTWTGTLTVTGGTGVYKGIKGKKNSGVMNCSSADSVHLTCTEKVKVTMPPAA
jgi:hypothetical protein